jgi:D-alanine-D-alanine ligase
MYLNYQQSAKMGGLIHMILNLHHVRYNNVMQKYRIAILRGGPSDEHEVSLNSGSHIIDILTSNHTVVDIVIDKNVGWYFQGSPVLPAHILKSVDVVINALHGTYGEDGKVQQILDHIGVPYTGSRALASALGMHKWRAKEIFKLAGIKTPHAKKVSNDIDVSEQALQIFKTFSLPVIIKPISSGSSVGVSVARDLQSLEQALVSVFSYCDTALVEEYIKGKEATCVVAENFRGEKYYAFPPIEIMKHTDVAFDNEMKYSGKIEERCPGNFTENEKKIIMQSAIIAHTAIGARHYSRSDFIVHPTRGIYILEINTLPGLTETSLLPKALNAVGSNMKDFLNFLIGEAIKK